MDGLGGRSSLFGGGSTSSSSAASSNASNSWQGGKEWQEGLRALLPNVNVSFGNLPGGGAGGNHNNPLSEPRPSNMNLPPFPTTREEQQHHMAMANDRQRKRFFRIGFE